LGILTATLLMFIAGCATLSGTSTEKIIDDETITANIKAKISAEPELRGLKVTVGTKAGEVVLSGTVPDRDTEVRLIKLALGVKGVKSVKDNLAVRKK
jgi:osmotically-inducible protein OsmY